MITTTFTLTNSNKELTVTGTTLREFEYKLRIIHTTLASAIYNEKLKDEKFINIAQPHPDHDFSKEEDITFIKLPVDQTLFIDLYRDLDKLLKLSSFGF